jgi:hypothetical protein
MIRMDLPEALVPIAFLLGTWRGDGHGVYPTIEPFDYGEEVTFACPGKPFLAYRQRTWRLDDGTPLHAETGYWRPGGAGLVEVMIAHPFGATELLEGSVSGTSLKLASRNVGLTSTAKSISATERDVEVVGSTLRYRVGMAAVGLPMTHHLSAILERQPST